MSAALTPERLGGPTTISAGFRIAWSEAAPACADGVSSAYPQNLGFATSGLGSRPATPRWLRKTGRRCAPRTHAWAAAARWSRSRSAASCTARRSSSTLLAGPSPNGILHVLVSGVGSIPVSASVVLSARTSARRPEHHGPADPDAAGRPVRVARRNAPGARRSPDLLRTRARQDVAYHPPGIGLPRTCPRGGFRFARELRLPRRAAREARAGWPVRGGRRRRINVEDRPLFACHRRKRPLWPSING